MPELETIPQKWNGKTNWVPKLDCEQNEERDWRYWSWDCEEEEEESTLDLKLSLLKHDF
jgi:hypothetical protein